MTKLVFYTIEPHPLPAQTVTLDMMPEGVECVCSLGHGEVCVRMRVNDTCDEAYSVLDTREAYRAIGASRDFTVHSRLDGQPLPVAALPKTLAEGEEGRLYKCGGISVPLARLDGHTIQADEQATRLWSMNFVAGNPITRALPFRVVRHEIDPDAQ